MDKKFNRFYYISLCIALLLVLLNITVKGIIWFSSFEKLSPVKFYRHYAIMLAITTRIALYRYTSTLMQNIFYSINHLLPVAFTIFFAITAARLSRIPGIFEEDH